MDGGIVFNAGPGADDVLTLETTGDPVRLNGPVSLETDVRIDTDDQDNDTVGGDVLFTNDAPIDSQLSEFNELVIDAGTARVFFNEDIGANADESKLGRLVIEEADGGVWFGEWGSETSALAVNKDGDTGPVEFIKLDGDDTANPALDLGKQDVIGGIVLNGGTKLTILTTGDAVRINGPVTLESHVEIDTTDDGNYVGGSVTFTEAATVKSQGHNLLLRTGGDVSIDSVITSDGGPVELVVDKDVDFGPSGGIDSDGGPVTVTAGNDGSGVGEIRMADGSEINAGVGPIVLEAPGNIQISLLTTTSDVTVTSDTGAISDADNSNGLDVRAATLFLDSATGVGGPGMEATLETETAVAQGVTEVHLEAVGGTGGVFIANKGNLEIGGVHAGYTGVSAAGEINISALSDLTISEKIHGTGPNSLVYLTASGNIRDSQDAGGLDVEAARLVLSAGQNVGASENPLDINPLETRVRNLEAFAQTGRVFLDNTGNLEIGHAQLSVNGVAVRAAGEINISASSNLTVSGGILSTGGTVNLDATGSIVVHYVLGVSEVVAGNINTVGVGQIKASAQGGAITIDPLAVLESRKLDAYGGTSGKVTNAPPLLTMAEKDPSKALAPNDRTQELTGFIGVDGNLELGANFVITVTPHNEISTVIDRAELDRWYKDLSETIEAGDKLTVLIEADATSTKITGLSVQKGGSSSGPVELDITIDYDLRYLIGVEEPEVGATITIQNDPQIKLYDNLGKLDEHLNTVSEEVLTSRGGAFAVAQAATEFERPAVVTMVETAPVFEIRTTPPQPPSRVEEIRSTREATAEDVRELYIVEVNPDGSEGERQSLPEEALANLTGLFDRFQERRLPDGLYRIYLEETGFPRRMLMEFYKAGETFGSPDREPGRGSKPALEQETQIPAGRESIADMARSRAVDGFWMRWTARNAGTVWRASAREATPDVVDRDDHAPAPPAPSDEGGNHADDGRPGEISESPSRLTHPSLSAAVLAGGSLSAYSALGSWERSIDKAMEDSKAKSFTKAARLCRRFWRR